MNIKKCFTIMTVGVAVLVGSLFSSSVEAGYGVFDVGAMNRSKKVESNNKATPGTKAKPKVNTANPRNNAFSYVTWSLQGTITQEKKGISGVAMYVVEYDDGTETPKYYLDGNTIVFENISKGQLVSSTREKGEYVTLDFRAPDRINVILFAPSLGMRYFSLDKRNYLGRYDYDFGPLDDTKAVVYHSGIIQ